MIAPGSRRVSLETSPHGHDGIFTSLRQLPFEIAFGMICLANAWHVLWVLLYNAGGMSQQSCSIKGYSEWMGVLVMTAATPGWKTWWGAS